MPQSRKRHTAKRTHTRTASPERQQARAGAEKRKRIIAAVVVFALVAAGAAYLFAPGLRGGGGAGPEVTTPTGLKYTDLVVGTGPSPRPGQSAVVHYTGTLTDGTKFDSSRDKGQPYTFVLQSNPPSVIKGWDEGVATMKVGGRRRLVVPPALGYGPRPRTGIPPNSTLVFDVELLDVK